MDPDENEAENSFIADDESCESNQLLPSHVVCCSPSYSEEEKDIEGRAYFSQQVYGVIEVEALDDNQTPPFSWKKLWLYTGPGILMSIAFLDPGK